MITEEAGDGGVIGVPRGDDDRGCAGGAMSLYDEALEEIPLIRGNPYGIESSWYECQVCGQQSNVDEGRETIKHPVWCWAGEELARPKMGLWESHALSILWGGVIIAFVALTIKGITG